MGFFSWDCKSCERPLLGPGALDRDGTNAWMQQAVALSKRGDRMHGDYDGYGRLDGVDIFELTEEPALYHAACYELAGKPEFTTPSRDSADQGYFFAPGEYTIPDPRRVTEP